MSAQLERLPDWDLRLVKFIEARASQPFEWGKTDCCRFAADAIQAMTGADVMAEYRDRYSDFRGAVSLIKKFGSLLLLTDKVLSSAGFQIWPNELLGRGDIVLVEGGTLEMPMVAVHLGNQLACPDEEGLALIDPDGVYTIKVGWSLD